VSDSGHHAVNPGRLTEHLPYNNPTGLRLERRPTSQHHETSIPCNDPRLPVHRCGSSRPRLSPFGKAARSLDLPRLDRSHNRCRRRSLLAHGSQLGSLADARLARLSRCRERISLAVGIYAACSAVDDSRLCPIGAAYFQIFSVCAIRVRQSDGLTEKHWANSRLVVRARRTPGCASPGVFPCRPTSAPDRAWYRSTELLGFLSQRERILGL
jgi:hypothetical protein